MKLKKFGGTEQKVYDLIKPITDELEYFLWDVSYVKEGAIWYLRIFIDRDEGISIEDCERATAPISEILDKNDPIPQSYMLEVGSAGLERELLKEEHFEVCIGDKVRIRFIRSIDGEKEVCAVLRAADKESVTVICDGGDEKVYPLADIAYVKLYLDFE
ncbi:MAG TPA: ribosome maturation factor RimP [Ruminococcus sp.]